MRTSTVATSFVIHRPIDERYLEELLTLFDFDNTSHDFLRRLTHPVIEIFVSDANGLG